MKKKIAIDRIDFEAYANNALKSYGFLFPDTDEQMDVFEETMESITLPSELESPSFVFDAKSPTAVTPRMRISVRNDVSENNWAVAARDGKNIPDGIWAQMKRDKEEAKKKTR
jgi:hypothetical protein